MDFGNKLPRNNKGQFLKGITPFNKNGKNLICRVCNRNYYVPKYREFSSKTCSQVCQNKSYEKISKKEQVRKMAAAGLTAKQMSEKMNCSTGAIYHFLIKNKYDYKRRDGLSRAAAKNRLIKKFKSCLICGNSRVLEVAHIKPARHGGTLEDDNLVILCANCHYLFDHKKLTEFEAKKLSTRINNWWEYITNAKQKKHKTSK